MNMNLANKKAATIGTYLIGLLVFGALITGVTGLLNSFNTKYPQEDGFAGNLTNLNKYDESLQAVQDISNQTRSDDLTAIGFFTKGSWASIQLIFNSFSFFGDIVTNASQLIGLPSWLGALIIGIVLITVVLLIVSAIFRHPLL